jgi:hypothetical protein
LWRDLGTLRRYIWVPLATVAVGVAAALLLGAYAEGEQEARFRSNVVVNALPPLFGPPVLPGPFDYAAVATSDATIEKVASQHSLSPEELSPRLTAEPRVNSPEIDFRVTGDDALAIADTWNAVFQSEVVTETPRILEALTEPYRLQRDEAEALFLAAAEAEATNPGDPLNQARLAATQENYETAVRLVQSYDVVQRSIAAQAFAVKAPHEFGGGLGSPTARIAAGALLGLVLGMLLALMLDAIDRRRSAAIDEAPPSLRRVEQRTGSSR